MTSIISRLYDEAMRLTEAILAAPFGPERDRLIAERRAVAERQTAVQERADAAWEAAAASTPPAMRLLPDGSIRCVQTLPGGGRSWTVGPLAPEYTALRAEMARGQSQDARVAEVAFGVWGWRGPVRIDYLGDDLAIVRRGGGPNVRVELATMTGTAR